MNGKVLITPRGMFKKYYCSNCGTKLEKEKTHRIVKKKDIDYYEYHDAYTYPRKDYDVYKYRLKCPSCQKKITFYEQRIIKKIQKQRNSIILSQDEINEYYKSAKRATATKSTIRSSLHCLVLFLFFGFLFINKLKEKPPHIIAIVTALYSYIIIYNAIVGIRQYKGTAKFKHNRCYSYKKTNQLEKLHTYASHNRELVEKSSTCHCFYCKSSFESSQIISYTTDEESALCPECNNASVIPDSINEPLNEVIISEMHDYWF